MKHVLKQNMPRRVLWISYTIYVKKPKFNENIFVPPKQKLKRRGKSRRKPIQRRRLKRKNSKMLKAPNLRSLQRQQPSNEALIN
jgi:hypothetical protein